MDLQIIVERLIEKYPQNQKLPIKYGTAGFRTKADDLDVVISRMGVLASIRSIDKTAAVGVMITASHNPLEDNGIKLVDPQGEMLAGDWEKLASDLANVKDEELLDNLNTVYGQVISGKDTENIYKPIVIVGRDTRPSSERLQQAVEFGAKLTNAEIKDLGIVSTPILHYIIHCFNGNEVYGKATESGYMEKLSSAFLKLCPKENNESSKNCNYTCELFFDGANGVGAQKMLKLMQYLQEEHLKVQIFNQGEGKLNHRCGADFVKTTQSWPDGVPQRQMVRCASVDGDADRIMYGFIDTNGLHRLLDGDRISCLVACQFQELIREANLDINLGVIQTAYANGASSAYLSTLQGLEVSVVPTGVKHLHHKAKEFDVGVYFEANGHGTVLFSDKARDILNKADSPSGRCLCNLMNVINETVGDAISDLLLVEGVLSMKGWGVQQWLDMYTDLPSRLVKVRVQDRDVVTTTDAERICVTPVGLQQEIDALCNGVPSARAFVRSSGTEDVVRIYAEADTQEDVRSLATKVAEKVYDLAGGVGDRPTLVK